MRRSDELRAFSADYEQLFADAAASVVEEGVALAREAGLDASGEAIESGAGAWRALAEVAGERGAAVIVAGSRGRGGLASTILGSVSSGLVHNAETPALIVRPGGLSDLSEPPRDPEELGVAAEPVRGEIAAGTSVGAVRSIVADLERSLAYYGSAVGLAVIEREAGRARIGVGDRVLVVLEEQPGARSASGYTGLYHFALLVPERVDLARWLAHAARERVPLVGLADHFVSEALYLSDPDGHGIEIYWDRPRAHWEGQVAERMTTEPLNAADLLSELDDPAREPFEALAPGPSWATSTSRSRT